MMYMKFGEKDNFLGVQPGLMLNFLSDGGKNFGYGYGPGQSIVFGTKHGDIQVKPGQWVIKDNDGRVSVHDEKPGIKV